MPKKEKKRPLAFYAEEMAKVLNMDVEYSITPTSFRVKLGEVEERVSIWHTPPRVFMWLAAVGTIPFAATIESLGLAPQGFGLLASGAVVSGLGYYCLNWVDADFEDLVQRMEIKAEGTAVDPERRGVEALLALYGVENRPLWSTKLKFWRRMTFSNNIEEVVADPIRAALDLLITERPKSYMEWEKRSLFDTAVKKAFAKLDTWRPAWMRTVKPARWLIYVYFWASVIFLIVRMLYLITTGR